MTDVPKKIADILQQSNLQGQALKNALREIVRQSWPDMPPWTTLDTPVIEEVQKATVGSGVVLTFEENGIRKVVLGETGDHYKKPGSTAAVPPSYMIPGGFINLTRTPGSSLVAASKAPEDARTGAAREIEEELKSIDGSPLLKVDPARLKPMDTKTLSLPWGETRLVIGLMLDLTAAEILIVKNHVKKLGQDPAYKTAAALQTINGDSGLPEVSSVSVFTLEDVAQGKCNLLHKDQQSLFQVVSEHFASSTKPVKPKTGPTPAKKPSRRP